MTRKAQATLEIAVFVGVMLMILVAAMNYRRNLYEQRQADVKVFADAKKVAGLHKYVNVDLDGEEWPGSGATISYSLNADRQANYLFQGGQRRTSASNASVYWSNSEDPDDLNFNYYNNTNIAPDPEKKLKIYYDRPGSEDPEDGMKLSTAEYIAIAYPIISTLVRGLFNLKQYSWYRNWGGWIDFAMRAASFAILLNGYLAALKRIDDSEGERLALAKLDEQMGDWGWRVCDITWDGKGLAGKKYVKEVTASPYDTMTTENKSISYSEVQTKSPAHNATRSVGVGHTVNYDVFYRYDITAPDPTIPLAGHTFQDEGAKGATVTLGGGGSETWSSGP
jgi:hypothetical protein